MCHAAILVSISTSVQIPDLRVHGSQDRPGLEQADNAVDLVAHHDIGARAGNTGLT